MKKLKTNNLSSSSSELGIVQAINENAEELGLEDRVALTREVELEDGTIVTVESITPEAFKRVLNNQNKVYDKNINDLSKVEITDKAISEPYMSDSVELKGLNQEYNDNILAIDVKPGAKTVGIDFNIKNNPDELADYLAENKISFPTYFGSFTFEKYVFDIARTRVRTHILSSINVFSGVITFSVGDSSSGTTINTNYMYINDKVMENVDLPNKNTSLIEYKKYGKGWYKFTSSGVIEHLEDQSVITGRKENWYASSISIDLSKYDQLFDSLSFNNMLQKCNTYELELSNNPEEYIQKYLDIMVNKTDKTSVLNGLRALDIYLGFKNNSLTYIYYSEEIYEAVNAVQQYTQYAQMHSKGIREAGWYQVLSNEFNKIDTLKIVTASDIAYAQGANGSGKITNYVDQMKLEEYYDLFTSIKRID